MPHDIGEQIQREHGGGMKIAALPGMLPEGLHHLLIGRFLRVAQEPFRQHCYNSPVQEVDELASFRRDGTL